MGPSGLEAQRRNNLVGQLGKNGTISMDRWQQKLTNEECSNILINWINWIHWFDHHVQTNLGRVWWMFFFFKCFFGWFPAFLRPFLPAGLLNSGCLSSLSKFYQTSLDIKLIGCSHSGIHAFGMLWCRRGETALEFDHSNHLNHLKFQQFQREALFFATPIFRGALFQLDLAGDKTFWCVVWSIRSSHLQIDSYLDVFGCF